MVTLVIFDGFLNFFFDACDTAVNDLSEIACRMLPFEGQQIVYRFVIKILEGDPEVAVTVPVVVESTLARIRRFSAASEYRV